MAATTALTNRQALLRQHLAQVKAVLTPLQGLDRSLYERLQPLLELEVTKLTERLDSTPAAENPWAELREVREDAEHLFTECLGFLGGAVALHSGLDQGWCRVANHLVASLRRDGELHGYSVSVPAEREYVNCLSSLIRLRFPGQGLWDLPAAVHEFAHAVCDQLGGGSARAAVKAAAAAEQDPPGRLRASRYEELWGDVFGAYVAGPAFAATCLRLRFDASLSRNQDSLSTHPSVDKRVVAIVATLRSLEARRAAKGRIAGSMETTISDLERAWQAELAAAGRGPSTPEITAHIEAVAASYREVLDTHVPTLRYPGLGPAEGAKQRLVTGQPRPPAVGVIDTLNGAWLARMDAERDGLPFDQITSRAQAWCKEIADG